MMTLSVSSGTWSDAVTAAMGEHTYEWPRGGSDEDVQMVDRMLRAALSELQIEIDIADRLSPQVRAVGRVD